MIMDGNKRWSDSNGVSLKNGYIQGFNKIEEIIKICITKKITPQPSQAPRAKNNLIFKLCGANFSEQIYRKTITFWIFLIFPSDKR